MQRRAAERGHIWRCDKSICGRDDVGIFNSSRYTKVFYHTGGIASGRARTSLLTRVPTETDVLFFIGYAQLAIDARGESRKTRQSNRGFVYEDYDAVDIIGKWG